LLGRDACGFPGSFSCCECRGLFGFKPCTLTLCSCRTLRRCPFSRKALGRRSLGKEPLRGKALLFGNPSGLDALGFGAGALSRKLCSCLLCCLLFRGEPFCLRASSLLLRGETGRFLLRGELCCLPGCFLLSGQLRSALLCRTTCSGLLLGSKAQRLLLGSKDALLLQSSCGSGSGCSLTLLLLSSHLSSNTSSVLGCGDACSFLGGSNGGSLFGGTLALTLREQLSVGRWRGCGSGPLQASCYGRGNGRCRGDDRYADASPTG